MTKPLRVTNMGELVSYKESVLRNLSACREKLQTMLESEETLSLFAKLKYEKVGVEPLTGEAENLIEVINQAQTYLVSLMAVEYLFNRYPEQAFIVNWGNIPGYDIESLDGTIIAEVFAATSYRSNGKLAADLQRLASNATAVGKYEFFHDREFQESHRLYYKEKYPDIEIIKFEKVE